MPSALVTSVGLRPFEIVSFVITHLETSWRDGSSNITSSRAPSRVERGPRAPGAGGVGCVPQRGRGEDELDRVVVEEALVLPDKRVLGLREDLDEVLAFELV